MCNIPELETLKERHTVSCLIRVFKKISLYTRYDFESLKDGDLTQRKMEVTTELMYRWESCLSPTLSLLLGYKSYLALHGFWGPELHPPVCTVVILVIEPSPQALESVS